MGKNINVAIGSNGTVITEEFKGLTRADMVNICEKSGSHYLDKDSIKFFGAKIHDYPNKYRLFIESINNFDSTKRLYMVRFFDYNGQVETIEPSDIAATYEHFSTLKEARAFRHKLVLALNAAAKCYRENAVLTNLIACREKGFNSGVYTLKNGYGDTIEINTNNFDRFICG